MPAVVAQRGSVHFIGGGPGAPDLLTVRGARAIAAADVVIWGRDLLMEEVVTDHAAPGAELVPWPPATMADIHAVYDRAAAQGLVVARLHAGDPTLYGMVQGELAEARRRGLECRLVPGVSALGAAGAALGRELTTAPGDPAPLILAAAREDPDARESLAALAAHGTTMALFMSARRPYDVQRELIDGGYAPETPCAVVHRATWPEEVVVTCRLDRLGNEITSLGLERQTLIVVGPSDR